MEIEEKILTHKRVYEAAGLEVVPFFITYRENLFLTHKMKRLFGLEDTNGLLERYCDVPIKVCVLI